MEIVRNGKTATLLKKMGTKPGLLGWKYLNEAVDLVIEEPMAIDGITKILYPTIAKKFGTTPTRVERAIRHAIEKSYYGLPLDMVRQIFGNTMAHGDATKPTNKEFIAAVAQVVAHEPDNPVWSV